MVFYHPERDLSCVVHGDDFISTGLASSLKWFEKSFNNAFQIKTHLIGPEETDNKEFKVLNRIIRYTKIE